MHYAIFSTYISISHTHIYIYYVSYIFVYVSVSYRRYRYHQSLVGTTQHIEGRSWSPPSLSCRSPAGASLFPKSWELRRRPVTCSISSLIGSPVILIKKKILNGLWFFYQSASYDQKNDQNLRHSFFLTWQTGILASPAWWRTCQHRWRF